MPELSESQFEEYWAAIQSRSRDWVGKLYYGVKTTGIFCRPDCPSKRPGKNAVVFFHTAQDAREAGFRACKRCRPDQSADEIQLAEHLVNLVDASTSEITTVAEWAALADIAPQKLRKIITSSTGLLPRDFLLNRKMQNFKQSVQKGENLITSQNIAGFGSSSRLYEKAHAHLGMTPGKYRRGGMGEKILYSIMDTPLGMLILAATDHGICSIKFGDSEKELANELKTEFPLAEIEKHHGELTVWLVELEKYFSRESREINVPLDAKATAFQLKVWSELRKIPFGETRSYSQIAEAIGQPSAARAVASACARNPVAVVTPCHRVVHSDGSVSGYRWGLERKKALLLHESKTEKIN